MTVNGTHHLLVYAEDVNLLNKNINYSMEKSPCWKCEDAQLVNKFPTFFITDFTRDSQWTLSWAR
jgi:hypothetical protein